jgi:hypothetical protein
MGRDPLTGRRRYTPELLAKRKARSIERRLAREAAEATAPLAPPPASLAKPSLPSEWPRRWHPDEDAAAGDERQGLLRYLSPSPSSSRQNMTEDGTKPLREFLARRRWQLFDMPAMLRTMAKKFYPHLPVDQLPVRVLHEMISEGLERDRPALIRKYADFAKQIGAKD